MLIKVSPTWPADAAPSTPAHLDERGIGQRYVFLANPPTWVLVCPGLSPEPALLYDISRLGVGLILARESPPGTVLLLNLPGPRAGDTLTRSAKVVQATALPGDRWLVACRLNHPLSEQELQDHILRDAPAARLPR
jgi:hypothetical protein